MRDLPPRGGPRDLQAPFTQHDELRRFLLGTGSRVLVEASPVTASGASAWAPTIRAPTIRACGTA